MELDLSPRSLMQILLNDAYADLLSFINKKFTDFPDGVRNNWLIELNTSRNDLSQGNLCNVNCDLQKLIRLLVADWKLIKQYLVNNDESTSYGSIFLSYLFILKHARNVWAHQNNYTYEDVLFYGFIVQRFYRNTLPPINTLKIDQMVEFCIEEISKNTKEIQGKPDAVEQTIEVVQVSDDIEHNELVELEEDEEFEEVEGGDEEEEIEEEEVELEEKLKEVKNDLVKIAELVEKGDYCSLADMVGVSYDVEVSDGKYPNTLYITYENTHLCLGLRKLQLMFEYLAHIAAFVYFGHVVDPDMRGEYKGYEIICIPSTQETRVSFGINKAKLFCAAVPSILDKLL